MTGKELYKTTYDLLYLVACALHSRTPSKEALDTMELDTVYELARFHSLQAISYAPLEWFLSKDGKNSISLSETKHSKWKNARPMTLRKGLALDLEREKLFAHLEELGIWYMPLKGLVLRKLYPQMGWRQMADNDILFDPAYRKDIRDYMVESGFKVDMYEKGAHDVYLKDPYCNFEMHVSFYSGSYGDEQFALVADYYTLNRPEKSLLIRDSDGGLAHHMSAEDFYIYITTHAFRHFRLGGTGLRTLVDAYVYLSRYGEELNWNYIREELTTMGIAGFEEDIRTVSMKIFAGADYAYSAFEDVLNEKEQELLLMHANSGTFGTMDGKITNLLEAFGAKAGERNLAAKVRYCFRRAFPDMNYYKENAPVVYRHKILIPGYVLLRAFKAIFIKRKLASELKMLNKK